MYRFLWNGPDRIPRITASERLEKGGLNLPEIDTVVTATMLGWLRRARSSKDPWVDFLKWDASRLGGIRAILRGQKKTYDDDTHLEFNKCLFQEVTKLSNLEAGTDDIFMKTSVWDNFVVLTAKHFQDVAFLGMVMFWWRIL